MKEWKSVMSLFLAEKGGPGSGNFGHSGRPGEVGGSGEGGGDKEKPYGPARTGQEAKERWNAWLSKYPVSKDLSNLKAKGVYLDDVHAEMKEYLKLKEAHSFSVGGSGGGGGSWVSFNEGPTARTAYWEQRGGSATLAVSVKSKEDWDNLKTHLQSKRLLR